MGIGDLRTCKRCNKTLWIMWGYVCKSCLEKENQQKLEEWKKLQHKKQIIHEPTVPIHIRLKKSLMDELNKYPKRNKLIVHAVKRYLEYLYIRENSQNDTKTG